MRASILPQKVKPHPRPALLSIIAGPPPLEHRRSHTPLRVADRQPLAPQVPNPVPGRAEAPGQLARRLPTGNSVPDTPALCDAHVLEARLPGPRSCYGQPGPDAPVLGDSLDGPKTPAALIVRLPRPRQSRCGEFSSLQQCVHPGTQLPLQCWYNRTFPPMKSIKIPANDSAQVVVNKMPAPARLAPAHPQKQQLPASSVGTSAAPATAEPIIDAAAAPDDPYG